MTSGGDKELSLLEAFRALGRLTGDPREDERRQRAAERLFRELRSIAGLERRPDPNREDAVANTLFRLVRQSPLLGIADAPDTNARVRGYLKKAFFHNLISIRHAWGSEVPDEDIESAAEDGPDLETILETAEASRALESARRELLESIVPVIAAKLRGTASDSFLKTFQNLSAVSSGQTSMRELVAGQLAGNREPAGATEEKQARNRVDQGFSRVRRALYKQVAELKIAGVIDETRYLALQIVIDELRIRDK